MTRSKRTILIELEYMKRGLIPRNVKTSDVTSEWSPEKLKAHHRKFRKVFRKALKWEVKNMVSVKVGNKKIGKKIKQRYIDPEYYKDWCRRTGVNVNEEIQKEMMRARRGLVHRYICWLVDSRRPDLMKKK